MTIDLLFLTYNRLDYTKLSLTSVLADPSEAFSLTIWDNNSTDGTVEYLQGINDPRIKHIEFSARNVGQVRAVNEVWTNSRADLLGKLDNDCIYSPGWTRALAKAHEDISDLGVIACWHFMPEDFQFERIRHKIQTFGSHQIVRHPWTCGTGLLIKRDAYRRLGPLWGKGTTEYWMKMALAGWVNGFYYPLILQEHMDDPRSIHCRSRFLPFEQAYQHTVGKKIGHFADSDGCLRWNAKVLDVLHDGPFDPNHYARRRSLATRVRVGLAHLFGKR